MDRQWSSHGLTNGFYSQNIDRWCHICCQSYVLSICSVCLVISHTWYRFFRKLLTIMSIINFVFLLLWNRCTAISSSIVICIQQKLWCLKHIAQILFLIVLKVICYAICLKQFWNLQQGTTNKFISASRYFLEVVQKHWRKCLSNLPNHPC